MQQGEGDINIAVGAGFGQDRLRIPFARLIDEILDDVVLSRVERLLTNCAERTEISCSPERPP